MCRAARLGGRHCPIFPTASHATPAASSPQSIPATAIDAIAGRPHLDAISSPIPPPVPVSRRASFLRRGLANAPGSSYLQSPFRTRGGSDRAAAAAPWRPSAARLWNPTNSTPRALATTPPRRERRPSTPPPPSVPLAHPTAGTAPTTLRPINSQNHPLLTTSEPRPSLSNRASLQIERSTGSEQRISLPPSVRCSYDEKRVASPPPTTEPGPSYPSPPGFPHLEFTAGLTLPPRPKQPATMATPQDPPPADFSTDLERGPGPSILNNPNRHSTASGLSGIGSAISSSDSSIMGDPDAPLPAGDAGVEEWGPQHPCYPHLNPHVPVDSPEYTSTRIIRIRRDWLLEGDLAPTFSNLYPEILDPAGVSEAEFRRVVDKLNGELVPGFSPYHWRNVVDGVLGLATGWVWDDLGLTGIKGRLRGLERWIEEWNEEMARAYGEVEGGVPPRIVPLKRTGYMTIPDPEIATAPPSTADADADGAVMEEEGEGGLGTAQ
ncbi:Golgin subfamily A member 7/ERF4 family-domain-containing protein [Podospora conica]|nr:Golgin subfamily A member 7/ERF4 family-domain-containing protein [Schizothecium conicum]